MAEDSDRETVEKWVGELTTAATDGAWYSSRKLSNFATRMASWGGQSADGRKWSKNYGKRIFPWEGASDARIRLADMVINHEVQLLTSAFFRSRIQMQPVESSDALRKVAAEQVMKWMLFTHCADDLRREVELALNIRDNFGMAIMGVFWRTTTRVAVRPVSLKSLAAEAVQNQDVALDALVGAIMDPLQEAVAVEGLEGMVAGMGTVGNVRALRDGREIEWRDPYIFESRPEWTALEPWNDVIFPTNTYDIQRAPWVARRELVTCEELEERVLTEGYPEEFVELAEKKKGNSLWPVWITTQVNKRDSILSDENRDMIELWHVYSKEEDEKSGAMVVMHQVMHAEIKDMFAVDEVLDYEHGLYPFVELPRERVTRNLLESRGIPEVVESMQAEIKAQRDYRSDRASIAILPPMRVPANRGKLEILMGPAVQIPERRPNEFGWMQPPPFDQGTIEIERAVRRDVNEYFGIMGEGVDPNWVQLSQQSAVDRWLRDCRAIMGMTFQLMQQFMEPTEILRVTGGQEVPFSASREEIQGKFDLSVEFDVRDLDSEALGVKLDYIAKAVVPLDTQGVIDRAGLVKFVMGAIDPTLAAALVRDPGPAAAAEVADEQLAFTKIAAGAEPPLPGEGVNAELRAQTLQGTIQANPAVAQRYQGDEIFRAMIDARLKALNFQVEQRRNAVIGRVGAQPVLEEMGNAK